MVSFTLRSLYPRYSLDRCVDLKAVVAATKPLSWLGIGPPSLYYHRYSPESEPVICSGFWSCSLQHRVVCGRKCPSVRRQFVMNICLHTRGAAVCDALELLAWLDQPSAFFPLPPSVSWVCYRGYCYLGGNRSKGPYRVRFIISSYFTFWRSRVRLRKFREILIKLHDGEGKNSVRVISLSLSLTHTHTHTHTSQSKNEIRSYEIRSACWTCLKGHKFVFLKQVYYQLIAPVVWITEALYMFRLPSVAILREWQNSET